VYQLLIGFDILDELGIINCEKTLNNSIKFSINKDIKNKIENSDIYCMINGCRNEEVI